MCARGPTAVAQFVARLVLDAVLPVLIPAAFALPSHVHAVLTHAGPHASSAACRRAGLVPVALLAHVAALSARGEQFAVCAVGAV